MSLKKHIKQGSALVRVETEDFKGRCQMAGDGMAILYSLNVAIDRFAEISHQTRAEVIEDINLVAEGSRVQLHSSDLEISEDKLKALEDNIRHDVEKEWQEKYALVTQQKAEITALLNSTQISLAQIKNGYLGQINAKDKQIKELTKEIKSLEHRIEEIAKLKGVEL